MTSANFHSLPPISASVLSLRANAFTLSERGGVAVLRADHPNLLIGKWLRTKVTPPRYSNVAVLLGNVTLSPAQHVVRVCAQCNPIMRLRVRELGRIDHLCYVPGCNPKCPRLRAGNEKVSLGLPARRAVGR